MPRFRATLFAAATLLSLAVAAPGHAQYGGHAGRGGGDDQQAQDDAKRKKRDAEFGNAAAPLPSLKNAGPCPFVKVLYDAARYVEFKDNAEASANAVFTGEIENVASACAYKTSDPIHLRVQVLFEFGRGPQATSNRKVYRYWVAVTDRNNAVLDKAFFDLPVTFPGGQDRVTQSELVDGITIPRADAKVSGANFEVLVGFEVTPQMAAFNRDGKRFRANAGQVPLKAAPPPSQ